MILRCTAIAIFTGLLLGGQVGCGQQKLFPDAEYRSPYQRFEITRGQDRQATQRNVFGREVPNLRERLRPLDGPG